MDNSRVLEVKRVIGLLHLADMGLTKDKLTTLLEALDLKPSPTRTLS